MCAIQLCVSSATTATLNKGQASQYSYLARRTMGTIHSPFPTLSAVKFKKIYILFRFIQNNIIFYLLHKQQKLTFGVPETKHFMIYRGSYKLHTGMQTEGKNDFRFYYIVRYLDYVHRLESLHKVFAATKFNTRKFVYIYVPSFT